MRVSVLKRDVHRSPCRTTEEISSYVIVDFAVYNLFSFHFFGCWFNQCTQVVWDSININCIGDIAGSSEEGGRTHLVIDWCIRFCVYTQNSTNIQYGGTFPRLSLLLLLLFLIFASFPFAQVARSFLTVITVAMHFFGLCFRTWHMIVLVIFSSPPFASLSHAHRFLVLHFVVYSSTLHAVKIGIVAHIVIISVIWIIQLSLKPLQLTPKCVEGVKRRKRDDEWNKFT